MINEAGAEWPYLGIIQRKPDEEGRFRARDWFQMNDAPQNTPPAPAPAEAPATPAEPAPAPAPAPAAVEAPPAPAPAPAPAPVPARARLGVISFGLAMGVTAGFFVFVLGIVAGLSGWGMFVVEALSSVFIGYAPNLVGSIAGAVWAFVDGLVAGVMVSWLYNRFLTSRS